MQASGNAPVTAYETADGSSRIEVRERGGVYLVKVGRVRGGEFVASAAAVRDTYAEVERFVDWFGRTFMKRPYSRVMESERPRACPKA